MRALPNILMAQAKWEKGDFVALLTPSYTQYGSSLSNQVGLMNYRPVTKMTWDNASTRQPEHRQKILR